MTSQQLAEFDRKNLEKKLWLATSQRLDVVVDDIYEHYTKHWLHLDSKGDGTGKRYRAQLVTQSKLEAVRYYTPAAEQTEKAASRSMSACLSVRLICGKATRRLPPKPVTRSLIFGNP